jgi:hypothetical protein
MPDRGALETAIMERIGKHAANEIELEFSGDLVRILTMDPVFMVYAARVCVELGGQPCAHSGALRAVEWPEWTARPWHEYGWTARARIRMFGKFKLP